MGLSDVIADAFQLIEEASNSKEEIGARFYAAALFREAAEMMFCEDGDDQAVREALQMSAVQYRKSVEVILDNYKQVAEQRLVDAPDILEDALVTAAVSHDDSIQREVANLALEISEFRSERYGWTDCQFYSLRTYASSLTEHPGAGPMLEKAQECDDDPEDLFEPGIWTALQGVVTDDAALVRDGIDTHVTTLSERSDEGDDEIFFDGLAITLIARKHGHDITPDSPAIPEKLLAPGEEQTSYGDFVVV